MWAISTLREPWCDFVDKILFQKHDKKETIPVRIYVN
jgi:hypothetical protein